jgi:hypothetical protein
MLGVGGAASLSAQRIDQRRGLWFSAGVAAASLDLDCSFCTDDRKLGPAVYLQAGGTPSRQIIVGVEANGWRASDPDTTREFVTVSAVLYYYPAVQPAIFVKAGFGGGRYAEVSGPDDLSATGFMIQLGAGYDLSVGGQFWAAPFFHYQIAPDFKGKRNRIGLSNRISLNVLQLGARLSWH